MLRDLVAAVRAAPVGAGRFGLSTRDRETDRSPFPVLLRSAGVRQDQSKITPVVALGLAQHGVEHVPLGPVGPTDDLLVLAEGVQELDATERRAPPGGDPVVVTEAVQL